MPHMSTNDDLDACEVDESLPSYSVTDSNIPANRYGIPYTVPCIITDDQKPTCIYVAPMIPLTGRGRVDWRDTKNDIPNDVSRSFNHFGTKMNAYHSGSDNVHNDLDYQSSTNQIDYCKQSIVSGLQESSNDTRKKYHHQNIINQMKNNGSFWNPSDGNSEPEDIFKVNEKVILKNLTEKCKELFEDLVNTHCGDCRGFVVSRSTLGALENIQQLIEKDKTHSCLIYSKSLNPSTNNRGGKWLSNYLGMGGNNNNSDATNSLLTEGPPKIRQYIDYSKIQDEDLDKTRNNLLSLANYLGSKISEKIGPVEMVASMENEAKDRGVSIYSVDQEILDELTSCDPIVITQTRALSEGATF